MLSKQCALKTKQLCKHSYHLLLGKHWDSGDGFITSKSIPHSGEVPTNNKPFLELKTVQWLFWACEPNIAKIWGSLGINAEIAIISDMAQITSVYGTLEFARILHSCFIGHEKIKIAWIQFNLYFLPDSAKNVSDQNLHREQNSSVLSKWKEPDV